MWAHGLANYFAASLILPYAAFHSAANKVCYDVELLTDRYGM
ncbi:ImmA/IrrE family metallo-endopeptidase [Streptomyces cellulosae]|uniref:ImmA/IrrE family metallo-endopeptidase n=1 Tax=Streptomyces cellulosae TaxID=1968 RepID=A0ABW7Y8J4_STRCE